MKFNIYDYKNEVVECEIPNAKECDIDFIIVTVVTGDEIVLVSMKDGKEYEFDSSNERLTDYFDGTYNVRSEDKIKEWINWKPSGITYSYQRQDEFN